ncbi:lysozyme c-1-like [Halyomorpha halys]|uniref:lysozyme c-1-like n=1 Tax=Halyomorpha halys TaxID=286706 RepID=UPI0034D309E0|nr:Putative Lysozyme [Halyomorpha halys]
MLLLLTLLSWADAKTYEPCELAQELMAKGAAKEEVGTWVCIAKHESNFNTSAIGRLNGDGSADHGIFQISDRYWCSPQGWACNIPCDLLEDDDISDDWKCAKRIFRQHKVLSGNGFNAWAVYSSRCSGDNSQYVSGCFDKETSDTDTKNTIGSTTIPSTSTTTTSSTTTASYEETEKVAESYSAREGNNAEKVQVLDLEMMEKKGKSLANSLVPSKKVWKPWTWEIYH